jgi:two-component system alkaline phosphatase synthesis response regulator PhoP
LSSLTGEETKDLNLIANHSGQGAKLRMEKKAKILLVDDDIDFVEATKTILESKPYEVIVANEGDDGLRKARKENPDLILLDIIMPVKDGFTAAEQLKKDPQLSKIPVIMLTSFSTRGVGTGIPRGRGTTLEAEDYIEKPVSPKELLRRVETYLKPRSRK